MRAARPAAALAVLLSAAAARADDTSPPVISHAPVTRGERGKQTPVFAKITDESKIFPQIFFRLSPGSSYEKPIDMKPVRGQRNQWGGNLPPPPGNVLEYYIEAYDEFGNGPARAGEPERPFRIDFGPVNVAQEPTLPLPVAATSPRSSSGSGGRLWTWLAGGAGAGLLVGGIVASPLGSPRATALDVAGATLLAASVALYFIEAPRPSPAPSDGRERRADLRLRAGPGALALAARF